MSDAADAPLSGQVVVFTGRLSLLGRRDAQALVQRLGGVAAEEVTSRTTLLVAGADARRSSGAGGDGENSQKVRRARELNERAPGRIRIISEDEFCGLAALPSPDELRKQFYALRDVLGMYGALREDHLRYLEKWGLVQPVLRTNADRFYGFRDLGVFRQAHGELERGMPFRTVLRSLAAAAEGQLALDFRPAHSDAHPAKVVELESGPPARSAAGLPPDGSDPQTLAAVRYFMIGSGIDDGSDASQAEAISAYRKALLLDSDLVPALVNLANLHYARDALIEAQALYERAVRIDPDGFEGHFNLGNVHHDLGRYDAALAEYERAVALNPRYAEAHFYLAVTLEKLGRSQDAKPHWRAYRDLAPDGEWVELAREFSE